MPTTFDDNVSFEGKHALDILAPALNQATTLNNGGCTIYETVQDKMIISQGSWAASILQDGTSAAFDGATEFDLDKTTLDLTQFKVNEQFAKTDILALYQAAAANSERNGQAAPAFVNFVAEHIGARIASDIEGQLWLGAAAGTAMTGFLSNDGVLDAAGFAASSLSGADTVEMAQGTDTAANVIASLKEVRDEVAANHSGLFTTAGAGFYIGTQAYYNYMEYLMTTGNYNRQSYNQGLEGASYMGFPVYHCAGMPVDAVIFSHPGAMLIGTNLLTDMVSVEVLDLSGVTGDDYIRFVARFGFATGAAHAASDVVVGYNLV